MNIIPERANLMKVLDNNDVSLPSSIIIWEVPHAMYSMQEWVLNSAESAQYRTPQNKLTFSSFTFVMMLRSIFTVLVLMMIGLLADTGDCTTLDIDCLHKKI